MTRVKLTRSEATVTKFYEVKPPQGRNYDTLWDIADRSLGDPFRYNADNIDDFDF